MSFSYELYHQHPINKGIHFFCIPTIVLTSLNFLDQIGLKNITKYIYYIYYLNQSWKTFLIMSVYITILNKLSTIWKKKDSKWRRNSAIFFTVAWALQFFGHYVEGNKPALLDSLSSTVFQAIYIQLNI